MGGNRFKKSPQAFHWYVEPDTIVLTKQIPTNSQRNEKSSCWLHGVAKDFFVETLKMDESEASIFDLIPYFGWDTVGEQIVPVMRISYPTEDGTLKTEDIVLQKKLLDPLYKNTLKQHEADFRVNFRPDMPIPTWDEFKSNPDLTRPIGRSDENMISFMIPLVPTRYVIDTFGLSVDSSKVSPAAGEPISALQFARRCKSSASLPKEIEEGLDLTQILAVGVDFTAEQFDSQKNAALGHKFIESKPKKKSPANQTEGSVKMATKRKADDITPAVKPTTIPAPAAKVAKASPAVPVQQRAPQPKPEPAPPVATPAHTISKSPVLLSTSSKSIVSRTAKYARTSICNEVRSKRDENITNNKRYENLAISASDFLASNEGEFEVDGKEIDEVGCRILKYMLVTIYHHFCSAVAQAPLEDFGESGRIAPPSGDQFEETSLVYTFEQMLSGNLSSVGTRSRMLNVLESYAKFGEKRLAEVKNMDDLKAYVKSKVEGTSIPPMFAQVLVLEFISCAMFEDEGKRNKPEEKEEEEEDFM